MFSILNGIEDLEPVRKLKLRCSYMYGTYNAQNVATGKVNHKSER